MKDSIDSKVCSECDRPIFGRMDKKFCSDACRNAHNNRVNADATNFVRNVNNALRKNRRILLGFNPEGEVSIHRDKLLKSGFDFDYFTSSVMTAEGKEYKYCYDLGYSYLDDHTLLLHHRSESSMER